MTTFDSTETAGSCVERSTELGTGQVPGLQAEIRQLSEELAEKSRISQVVAKLESQTLELQV